MKKDKTPPLLKIVRWFFPKVEKVAPFLAHRYFIKIFFTPLRYPLPDKEKVVAQRADLFTIEVLGKQIQCYSWGTGPVVLLVHGWAGRATQFRKFIEALTASGYRAVAFDGPAHGRSEGKQTSIAEFEAVLKKIYETIGEPHAIIAHSFGGGAVLFAAMNGLPVSKLINIASPTIGDEIINTYLKAINGSPGTGVFFKSYILQHYGKSFDEFTSLHFIRHLKQEINLLLVHDENDKEVILKHAQELKKVYPGARLLVTQGLGHTRILKDDEVIRNCVTFISNGRLNGQ
ncbi:alpha/beta hydrolase [Fulvivirgaceae bacterium PWU4]|uniref:Alpha/beta hydrolase n=1 Tax=Chryseosolibacter histidini TaxID=2782349 RepID=A0AAP2GHQ3_9BACT|nr:alpha/beta fold hydrolase [Chryseosolibacter histidini]MBT1696291.1 alpha/beta hydrolase [Chryseosolibacter histidini]